MGLSHPVFRSTYFRLAAALAAVLFVTLAAVDRPVKLERRIEQRRVQEGKDAPTHWLVPVWLWKGLAANAGLSLLLLALTPAAARKISRPSQPSPPLQRRDRWLLAASVILLGASTFPRLGHSLWGDEEYLMKAYVAPKAEMQPDGSVNLTPRPWSTTLWDYERPTNHMGFTVLARLSHDLGFRPSQDARAPWFSETLLRLPSFLAGLGSLLTLVWCCRVWGWTSGLGWLAIGYAGHAWLVRFGCDARGYGIVLLLIPVLIGCLGRALQTGLWRWWLGFGFTQFYLIWTYPGILHIVAAANVLALALVLREPAQDRLAQGGRWLASGILSLMLIIGLMAPCLPPLLQFMKENPLVGSLNGAWFRDAATSVFCGVPWHSVDPGNPLATSLNQGPLPLGLSTAWLLLAATVTLGGAWAVIRCPVRWPMLLFLFGGPALLLTHFVLSQTRPYHWYLIPMVPNLFLLWAAFWNAGSMPWRGARAFLVLLALLGVHVLAFPSTRNLIRHPIEFCRESVALTRSITNPYHPDYGTDALTASPGMATEAYDPANRRFRTVEELDDLIAQARSRKVPLFLNFGYRPLLEKAHPEIFKRIDDDRVFQRVALLPGQFLSTTREVFRLRTEPSDSPAQD